jgi:SAM-dependent methyltransferase
MSEKMWDERYSEEGYAYGAGPNTFLRDTIVSNAIDLSKGAKCLMLAEGQGRNGVFMAEAGYAVTGVDISQMGLNKAAQLAKSRNVKIQTVLADLAEYDLGNEQWDCIVGIFCHLPPPIRERILTLIPKALRPGGYVVFEAYTPAQIQYKTGGPPDASLMYSREIFEKAFAGKLKIERNEELERDVVEGKYHTGKAAVVQLIARKEK